MSYQDFVDQDRRYLILKALQNSAGYSASSTLLQSFLDSFGQKVSADMLAGDLSWLAEQRLVRLAPTEDISVATILPRGQDIATGRATYPGIRRPAAGEI